MAAVAGVAFLWRGPVKGWEYPGTAHVCESIGNLPGAVLIVVGFFYATPETGWVVVLVGGLLAAISVVFGVVYAGRVARYRRFKEVIAGDNRTKKVPVLAGDELTPWARKAMMEHNLTEQQCFAGTPHQPYEAEQMWTPGSRVRVYQKMMLVFIVTLFCGTGALSWLSYAVEGKG